MALEAVVFPQDLFGYTSKEFYPISGAGGGWYYEFGGLMSECEMDGGGNWNPTCSSILENLEEWNVNSSSPEASRCFMATSEEAPVPAATASRRKRRRTKGSKNKEEVESQRMTHIAVERNRRKQMNEYLAVLRYLMPPSYVQRGDQASIVGGAINFVKELEQQLQALEAQKQIQNQSEATNNSSPFASFFIFPQYSSRLSTLSHNSLATSATITSRHQNNNIPEVEAQNQLPMTDIEVTMVERHANLRVLLTQQPKQLLKMVVGLQNLQLTPLHLNVTTTIDQMVLYSFSLKVEEDCQFTSVDEIAAAVYRIVGRIQKEDVCS